MFFRNNHVIDKHLHVDEKPGDDEVFLKCPICGQVYEKITCDKNGDWDDTEIPNFDTHIINLKKIKFIFFMCYDCYDNLDYVEEDYDENDCYNLSVLCYDEHMNLVHQEMSYY